MHVTFIHMDMRLPHVPRASGVLSLVFLVAEMSQSDRDVPRAGVLRFGAGRVR